MVYGGVNPLDAVSLEHRGMSDYGDRFELGLYPEAGVKIPAKE
ncbi:hypothetical protein [Sphingobacterium sp. E70]|nr:hypothetical protein [Sphingobacterium sp. E70]